MRQLEDLSRYKDPDYGKYLDEESIAQAESDLKMAWRIYENEVLLSDRVMALNEMLEHIESLIKFLED